MYRDSVGALSLVGVGVAAAAVAAGTAISISGIADIVTGLSMIVSNSSGGVMEMVEKMKDLENK
jgi:hypothetical protein